MRKIITVCVTSLLFAFVTGVLLTLLPGCANKQPPAGVTPLSQTDLSYGGDYQPPPGRVEKVPVLGAIPSSGYFFRADNATSPRRGAGTLPYIRESLIEEVWFIARKDRGAVPNQDGPGSGALMTKLEQREVPLPLKHTEVRAFIQGGIGSVQVSQQFQNPYSSKIEAVYVFPLPHDAAVNEFVMTIGERRIRGIVRERKEAEQLYTEAKRQGYVASLLTEERPNVFTQSVANIEPGKEILVELKYFHNLSYVDGWYEFVFPMVVGPRFNPPGTTNGIGAVARNNGGASQQATEIHYLAPGERSTHDIGLTVDIQAGVPIEEFECKTHQITHQSSSPEHLVASLEAGDVPNRDFILRYRIAGEDIKSSLTTHRDQRGGYFSLMLYPPRELESLRRQPLELVFVIDCSGSMNGRPIQQAKSAVQRVLQLLEPEDSFQLITFSMRASTFGARPLGATRENIRRASSYLASLNGEGGTMMLEGIKAALDFPHDSERLRFVCFLTDGYIGNESEILGEVHKRLGASRIFSFGIGSSVNRYLIESLGKVGHGAVAFLGLNDEAAQIMEDFFNRISHPALTDLKIDWGRINPLEVYPRDVSDLFVGRPVVLTGRFTGSADETVRISGYAGGTRVELPVSASAGASPESSTALPNIWARMKIAELADQSCYSPNPGLPAQMKKVALDYGLMSSFTAFIAVDASRRTAGTEALSVPVAVPVPEGVKYETTVQGE